MPCLSSKFERGDGPVINTGILRAGIFDPINPKWDFHQFPALLDTGASATCISPTVITAASLKPIGKKPMISATESKPVNIYLVDILLPFGNAGVVKQDIQVMEFATGNKKYEILIGRDIICDGSLTISYDGHFTFCL